MCEHFLNNDYLSMIFIIFMAVEMNHGQHNTIGTKLRHSLTAMYFVTDVAKNDM